MLKSKNIAYRLGKFPVLDLKIQLGNSSRRNKVLLVTTGYTDHNTFLSKNKSFQTHFLKFFLEINQF